MKTSCSKLPFITDKLHNMKPHSRSLKFPAGRQNDGITSASTGWGGKVGESERFSPSDIAIPGEKSRGKGGSWLSSASAHCNRPSLNAQCSTAGGAEASLERCKEERKARPATAHTINRHSMEKPLVQGRSHTKEVSLCAVHLPRRWSQSGGSPAGSMVHTS